ncbi:MAG TPA: hypothetical protein VHI77_10195 [Solirubrobacterales bacterium]|jgi:hypothetical protein|nr:hypothetical protein [Solirubrobacterales bacterium]
MYADLDDKIHEVWANADFRPDVPEVLALQQKKRELAAKIEAQGGDPEALTGYGDDSSDEMDSSDEIDSSDAMDLEGSFDVGELLSGLLPAPDSAAATLAADAISGAAALYNPDGSRVVVDLGTYEFDPPEWVVAIGEAILNGGLRDAEDQAGFEAAQADGQFGGATFGGQVDDSEGTTACPHTHTTDDNEVALCAN